MKIRPAQSTIGQMVTMLGGTNVQASAPEARERARARRGPMRSSFPWGSMFLFGSTGHKYHMDVPLYSTVFHLFDQKQAKYDSDARRRRSDRRSLQPEWAVKVARPLSSISRSRADAKMKAAAGHEVYELTPTSSRPGDRHRAALQSVGRRRGKTGANPDVLYKECSREASPSTARGFSA